MSPAPRFSPDQQQQMILDAAARCIEESSLMDFTMSAIAKETGLSMGSIYKQVQSKEDVLVALATRLHRHQYTLFSQMLSLPLTPVQSLIALKLMNVEKIHLNTFDQQLEVLMNSQALLKRASSQWRNAMVLAAKTTDELFSNFFEELVSNQQLALPSDSTIEELELATWAMCVGYNQIARQYHLRSHPDDLDMPYALLMPDSSIIKSYQRLLNTFDWKQPLTDDCVTQVCDVLSTHGLR